MPALDRAGALGISGSPSATSRSRLVVARVLERLAARGVQTELLDLGDLPAEALLGRGADPALASALKAVAATRVLVVGTPIYRATYSGLLKVFFDLLPAEALRGTIAIPVASGGGPAHSLMIDHGLRPLIASLGGVATAAALYVTPADFDGADPNVALAAAIQSAADEAARLGQTLHG